MGKYNIYIICKTEEDFLEKSKEISSKYKSKICHIQWIPAEYLQLTQCNKKLVKDLDTRWNTEKKKILAKLGTIAAHRKALLAIYMNKTDNNIILEADATLSHQLPNPPKVSCYMGGWIIPPHITKAGKVKINVYPKNDHRVAMSSTILSLLLGIKLKINNFQTTNTSFPGFISLIKYLGGKVEIKK